MPTKVIKLKNVYGETIEVKKGREKGIINIRHSDVHPKKFGQYHEYAARMRQPGFAEFAAAKGIDINSPEAKAALESFGAGFMLLHSQNYILNAQEVAMIRDAIKQLG